MNLNKNKKKIGTKKKSATITKRTNVNTAKVVKKLILKFVKPFLKRRHVKIRIAIYGIMLSPPIVINLGSLDNVLTSIAVLDILVIH